MKGFPNQVADLGKLATAMQDIVRLLDGGRNARDDGVLGEALVRSGVAGTGHRPQPIEEYLRSQRQKEHSSQSQRTTARGLRELFRILAFIEDDGERIRVTELGRRAAAFAALPMNEEQIRFWRHAIREMSHDGGDGQDSHPYQVLLRLIARLPDIEKPKCALALEAKNDSPEELERIVDLAVLPEEEIRRRLGVTRSNWANAVKVLPRLAKQLGDVVQTGRRGRYQYQIADAPGREDVGVAAAPPPRAPRAPRRTAPRPPRTSRSVTPETIGLAGTAETFDEPEVRAPADPAITARIRRNRLRRHNLIVRRLAARFARPGVALYELPFDVLAIIEEAGIMVEVKTLDGTPDDEVARVREALAQLLYYTAFLVSPTVGEEAIHKVACFERRPSDGHIGWLNHNGIAVIWQDGDRFAGDALASIVLGDLLEELRRSPRDSRTRNPHVM